MTSPIKLFRVDQKTCNQDGICAAVCPSRIITIEKGGTPFLLPGAEKDCIRCGHCVAACPTGSLDHHAMSAAQCPPVQAAFTLSPEHTEHFLRSRRSIRTYKSQFVPEKIIERLIRMARYAPSGRNSQDTEWLVMGNTDNIHKAASLVIDWMRWTIDRDPITAALMHLEKTVKRWEEGTDIIFRDAPVVIVAHAEKDNPRAQATCTIALTYLELAAKGFGLGCCWAGYFMRAATDYSPLMQALSLPNGHQCFGAMMVGFPKFNYYRLPLRNEPRISWRR